MSDSDVRLSLGITAAVLLLFVIFYNYIFAVTFDETFARATGTRAGACNALLSLLTALTVVVGMRMMGALLISGLVIFPALSAMRLCRQFRHVIICASVLSVLCFVAGTVISYAMAIPTGASVVCMNILVLLGCCGIGRLKEHR
jgi:zinc transport system permease protein